MILENCPAHTNKNPDISGGRQMNHIDLHHTYRQFYQFLFRNKSVPIFIHALEDFPDGFLCAAHIGCKFGEVHFPISVRIILLKKVRYVLLRSRKTQSLKTFLRKDKSSVSEAKFFDQVKIFGSPACKSFLQNSYMRPTCNAGEPQPTKRKYAGELLLFFSCEALALTSIKGNMKHLDSSTRSFIFVLSFRGEYIDLLQPKLLCTPVTSVHICLCTRLVTAM